MSRAAAAFAIVACVGVATEAWVARARMVPFAGIDFGRVLPILIVPETGVIFSLIIVFLTRGRLPDLLRNPVSVPDATVASIVLAFQVFAASSLAVLATVELSNQIRDLRGRGFSRALARADAGAVVLLLGFLWAFLQLGTL